MSLIGLVMIVKDEEKTLARTLASVKEVCDVWHILDTGSTDATVALAERAFEEAKVGGGVSNHTFEGYAASRNRALDLASETWALSLSADEVLHGGEALRAFLESYTGDETAILIEMRTPTGAFDYPRVLRVGSHWRYEGEIHEVPVHQFERSRKPVVKAPGCWITYAPSDPERHGKRLREVDVPLLNKQLSEATDQTERARLISLLGRTKEIIASTSANVVTVSQEMYSALGYYMLLATMADAPAEARKDAAWHFLNVAEVCGIYFPSEMVTRLRSQALADPTNPAVAYMLARHTADIGQDGTIRGNAREGLHAAQRAAKVALDQVGDRGAPHDPHGLLWRPHFIAAVCAKALGHGPAAKKSAQMGIDVGGPPDAFNQFLK